MIGTVQRNFIQKLGDAFAAYKAAPQPAALYPVQRNGGMTGPLSWPGWTEYEKEYGGDQSRDERRAKVAITSSWVFSDITAIANEASVAVLQVKKRDGSDEGETDVENHPLELVWEGPNPFMGRSFLMKFWIWQLMLSGKAFLFWVPKTDGSPGEVWPVPSFMLSPIPHPTKFIDGYMFKASSQSKPIKIEGRYITYSRLPHPFDIRDGLSPLAAIYDEIEADLAMARWNKTFFSKENAAPSGLIVVNKDTLDGDLARIRMEIMDFFGGNSGRRVGVARAGDMDWKPFDRSQKDMEFLQGRQFIRAEVDRVFGFPEGFWSKDATRANSEGAKATMIENAVWPHLVMLAEDLNAQTVPQWFGKDVRATFDDIRPRNRALELQEFTAWSTVLTVDELRSKISADEIGDPRGKMLITEVNKGTPIPATPASQETEEAISAMEDDAGVTAPVEEDAPAPMDAETPPEEDGGATAEVFSKAADLERWERKALKRLKDKGSAATPFSSDAIDQDTHARITEALKGASTAEAIKAIFSDVDTLLDDVDATAREWARMALEGIETKAQTPQERAMFANMGTPKGGGKGKPTGGQGGLWPKGADGKRHGPSASEGSTTTAAPGTAAPLNQPGISPTALPVRRFDNAAEGDTHLRREMGSVKATKAEIESLDYYQGGAYEVVNGHLRGTMAFPLDAKEREVVGGHIKAIDAVMDRSRTTENIEVHRGLFVNDRDPAAWELINAWQPGATFKESGYLSTTIDRKIVNAFSGSDTPYANGPNQRSVDVRIRVPAGTPAVYYNAVHPTKNNADEYELLLGRGLSYRVIGRTDNPGGKSVVDLEILP